jgi:hypothetical protein
MGMYDQYGSVQLKTGPCCLAAYEPGDEVEIADGVYIGWGGFVVIHEGKFLREFPFARTTKGGQITAESVLNR